MNKKRITRLLAVVTVLMAMSACTDHIIDDVRTELFTRAFIKEFGLIDPEQDWNMAQSATVKVSLDPTTRSNVKIYSRSGDLYYLVANLKGVQGDIDVPVDVPKGCNEVLVSVNGKDIRGVIGETINCVAASRGVPDYSYDGTTPADGNGKFQYPGTPVSTKTIGGYTVSVSHTTRGNRGTVTQWLSNLPEDNGEYQYFNTQQIAPLTSLDEWTEYYSLNTMRKTSNNHNHRGIVPECGIYNQTNAQATARYTYAQQVLDIEELDQPEEDRKDYNIMNEFRVNIGTNSKFTIYPYFYGTNLKHKLGIYLLDKDKKPLKRDGGTLDPNDYVGNSTGLLADLVAFEIFDDKEFGDIQVNPKVAKVTAIRILDPDSQAYKDGNKDDAVVTGDLKVTEGKTKNYVAQVKINDGNWQDFPCNSYTNRIAYHIWNKKDTIATAKVADYRHACSYFTLTGKTVGEEYMAIGCINDADNNGIEYNCKVVCEAAPDTRVTHTKPVTYNGWPAGLTAHSWSEYFETTYITSSPEAEQIKIAIRSDNVPESVKGNFTETVVENEYYSWTRWNFASGGTTLPNEVLNYFSSFNGGENSNFEAWYTSHSGDVSVVGSGSLMHPKCYKAINVVDSNNNSVDATDASKFNFYGNGFGEFYVLLQIQEYTEPASTTASTDWISGRQDLAKGHLKDYWNAHQLTETCNEDGCGVQRTYYVTNVEFVGTPNEDVSSLQYKVTWEHKDQAVESSNGAPRRHDVKSRADLPADFPITLQYDASVGWKEVNFTWNRYMPVGEETSSFCTDNPMLARTRGYDIEITSPVDGDFDGYVGFYLYVDKVGDGSDIDNFNPIKDKLPYVHFSERSMNPDRYGNNNSFAALFNHPKSGRTFFGFEDNFIQHPGPGEKGGTAYNNTWVKNDGDPYEHQTEMSSDRDQNDLIFFIEDIGGAEGDDKKITDDPKVETGYTWIWALEDLGSYDDFDFNDLVVRIQSITETTYDKDNNPTIVKKVVFKPLAAGGVLPLYIHLKVKGEDYVLEPSNDEPFDFTSGQSAGGRKPSADGLEFHAWFQNMSHNTIINTRNSGVKVGESRIKECVLIVDDNFKINLLDDHSSDKYIDTYTEAKNSTSTTFFYVTVNGSDAWDAIDPERANETGGTYLVPLAGKGQAPQSFVVNGDWRWPSERSHIMLAYPDFGKWVNKVQDAPNWTTSRLQEEYIY